MAARRTLSEETVAEVLVACRRKCCLCYYLREEHGPRKGQIAHLNQRADDDRVGNLVYLCLDHHDEFDSRTSQSKGLTPREVRIHRDQLLSQLRDTPEPPLEETAAAASEMVAERERSARHPWRHAWHFPLWLTADRSELFAYTAPGADGVCAIERVDLPDGRIAIACIQLPGNPGKSITNAAEYVFEQVCERFELPGDRVVWLENYENFDSDVWREVRFTRRPGQEIAEPEWTTMTPEMWLKLQLSPKKRLSATSAGALRSKLRKHFPWPPVTYALGLGE